MRQKDGYAFFCESAGPRLGHCQAQARPPHNQRFSPPSSPQATKAPCTDIGPSVRVYPPDPPMHQVLHSNPDSESIPTRKISISKVSRSGGGRTSSPRPNRASFWTGSTILSDATSHSCPNLRLVIRPGNQISRSENEPRRKPIPSMPEMASEGNMSTPKNACSLLLENTPSFTPGVC